MLHDNIQPQADFWLKVPLKICGEILFIPTTLRALRLCAHILKCKLHKLQFGKDVSGAGKLTGEAYRSFPLDYGQGKKSLFFKKKMYITLSLAHTIFKIGGDD